VTQSATNGEAFYLPHRQKLLSQGDLYLVPTSMAWSHEGTTDSLTQPPATPPRIGGSVITHAWGSIGARQAGVPVTGIETRWGPAMVLSHNCEIDKDFNEAVDHLVDEEGLEEAAAKEAASRDWDLDRYIVVAPLLSYEEISGRKHPGIRTGQRIGYFPVPPIPEFGAADYAVHLSRLATVERRLLRPGLKIASLETHSVKRLQYKIAEVFASRRLTLVSEIEAAVGREIVRVQAVKQSRKKATVSLTLDDGTGVP
jgi:hypothetical protein